MATSYLLTHQWVKKQEALVGSQTELQPTVTIQTPPPKSSTVSRISKARWDPRAGLFYPYVHPNFLISITSKNKQLNDGGRNECVVCGVEKPFTLCKRC